MSASKVGRGSSSLNASRDREVAAFGLEGALVYLGFSPLSLGGMS